MISTVINDDDSLLSQNEIETDYQIQFSITAPIQSNYNELKNKLQQYNRNRQPLTSRIGTQYQCANLPKLKLISNVINNNSNQHSKNDFDSDDERSADEPISPKPIWLSSHLKPSLKLESYLEFVKKLFAIEYEDMPMESSSNHNKLSKISSSTMTNSNSIDIDENSENYCYNNKSLGHYDEEKALYVLHQMNYSLFNAAKILKPLRHVDINHNEASQSIENSKEFFQSDDLGNGDNSDTEFEYSNYDLSLYPCDDHCSVCRNSGSFLCCDSPGCTRVYHLKCVHLINVPKDNWLCPYHFCSICKIKIEPIKAHQMQADEKLKYKSEHKQTNIKIQIKNE